MIPDMQYGSRPAKMCVSPVLNKVVSFDIVRQTKVTGAFIENDAVGCYDRLVNNLVFLELRHLSLPVHVLKAVQDAWNHACHHIKTKYGYSQCTYTNTTKQPLFGPGQGSTTGPPLWGVVFCLLVKNLPPDILTIFFKAVNDALMVEHNGDAFVDDAQLGCTSKLLKGFRHPDSTQDTQEVVKGLQYMAQSWEKLLFSTGGALNLQKSFWTLISWKWEKGIAKMSTPAQEPADLLLTEGYNSNPIIVPRLSPYEGYRTLGVYISPSGSTSVVLKKLQDISLAYATAITGSSLNHTASLWSYILYFLPKVKYPAPALTLSESDCHTILSPALMALLPKLHINRNTSRAIIHGPESLGGMHLPTVYTEQSAGQLDYFTGHLNLRDKTGKLLLISLTYLQLICGSVTPVLSLPYDKYCKWVEPTWLQSFWGFISKVGYDIHVHQQWLPILPRKNNHALMDHFMKLGYSASQLATLNRCRIYLQIIFLSDIVSADGRMIIPDCKTGRRVTDRISNLNWPMQDTPSQSAWQLWKQALAHFEYGNRLVVPLQQWQSDTHLQWRWFISPTTKDLFWVSPSDWYQASPIVERPLRRTTRSARKPEYDTKKKIRITPNSMSLLPVTLIRTERQTHQAVAGPAILAQVHDSTSTPLEASLFRQGHPDMAQMPESFARAKQVFIGVSTCSTGNIVCFGWAIYTDVECSTTQQVC